MKSNLLACLVAFCFSFTSSLQAQVSLPYYSSFDSAAERDGWAIYRLGEAALGNWSIANIGGYSAPSCISHDYSPSSGANVLDDWYVSPGFLLPSGGTLDSVRYAFSGFSVPTTGDTIGVYLLLGHQDPAVASGFIELAEFRDAAYQADNVYRLLTGIDLPATNEMAYIGLRYRNAEASSRWLHVRFDNIAVRESTTSIMIPEAGKGCVVYPNPTADEVTIQHQPTGGTVYFYDQTGLMLCQYQLNDNQTSTTLSLLNWQQGIYRLVIQQQQHMESTSLSRM
jgi:hypothetical protein